MDKAEALKYIETKGDSKFVVRTEEEENAFLANHAKKIEEEVIPSKISELHTRYDEDIFAVTGLRKNANEKTYDFTKRVLAEFKTKAEKASVLETEMDSLKKQITDGTADKKTLQDLEAVQKAYKELEDKHTKEVGSLKSEHEKFKIQSEIRAALTGMAFKKNIPEAALRALTEQTIGELTNQASYADGKLVFMENGVPKRNPHNALNPYTANEILKERFKDIIETGNPVKGPGITDQMTVEKDNKGKVTKVNISVPESVRTREDLSKYLVTAGLLRGSEEYTLAYKEYSAALPMR